MKIINHDMTNFPAEKYLTDFEGDTETHRFIETGRYQGNWAYDCYVRGKTHGRAFTITFTGSGATLDTDHDSYTATIQMGGTTYDGDQAGFLAAALTEAATFINIMLSNNASTLKAQDVACTAAAAARREMMRAERQSKLDNSTAVGEKEAKALIAFHIRGLKELPTNGPTFPRVNILTFDRVNDMQRLFSITLENGKVTFKYDGCKSSRGQATECIAKSDLNKLTVERVA